MKVSQLLHVTNKGLVHGRKLAWLATVVTIIYQTSGHNDQPGAHGSHSIFVHADTAE